MKKLKKNRIVLLINIGLLAILFIITGIIANKKEKKFEYELSIKLKEFPELDIYDSISGVVKSKNPFKGIVFINLSNTDKFHIERSVNYQYNPPEIYDFIEVSDSLYKDKNNDTLFVFKNGKKYYFILGEIINK